MLARETFNRIKEIKAVEGRVVIEVYDKPADEIGARKLESKTLSIKEAAMRAKALNDIVSQLPKKDGLVALDIVESTIRACQEAKKQSLSKNQDPSNPGLTAQT
jgi:hypothetical protein